MNYDETIEFLFNNIPNYQKSGKSAIRTGLTNIKILANYFNNPQNSFKSIHVGGTNGKGTTSTSIANLCLSLDLKVGLFTSPHIYDFRERIQINGSKISKSFIKKFIFNNKEFFESNDFSFFEINTIMAFEYFKYKNVDLAIIEVGLGGRLDSTNILNPIMSVVTNVGFDHQNILGDNIQDIAVEKSGIIKKNSIFIKGEIQEDIDYIFQDECKLNNVQYFNATKELKIISLSKKIDHRVIKVDYKKSNSFEIKLNNPTDYFFKNIRVALLVFIEIVKLFNKKLSIKNVLENKFKIYGRWNIISHKPYMISDGCHNIDAFQSVIKEINTLKFEKLYFIIGGVKEKKWDEICKILPKRYKYILTKPSNNRGIDTNDLSKFFKENMLDHIVKKDINDAIEFCKKRASSNDLIFIGGSLFLLSDYNEK